MTAALALAGCGTARAPERCRNWIPDARWDSSGWRLPPFAKLEEGALVIGEGPANGAVARLIERPATLSSVGVVAVGYARVETSDGLPSKDEDVTSRLWEGTVNLVNASSTDGRNFPGPYARLRFSGREIASGCWKRFVTPAIPAGKAKLLYPHFAFWGTRLNHSVKLRLAAMSLVEAPAQAGDDTEPWAACPNLPVPAPALASVGPRQWYLDQVPDGAFDDSFAASERPAAERGWIDLHLTARYRQGPLVADRFLVAVTEDGSDPRLSPTSRVVTVNARRDQEQWQATVQVRAGAASRRIAVAAAGLTAGGLRAQIPLLPAAWQK